MAERLNYPKTTDLSIAVDFDGTCVTHEYPNTGSDIGAVPILKSLAEKGNHLILFTMRSGRGLEKAIQWFKDNEVPLSGVQYNPTQKNWTTSNKCYAHIYIDDAALGCPLVHDVLRCDRPFVDWHQVSRLLKERGIL